ncbi:MAG: hypothetical protein ABFD79_01035, partial [Phycisphaerales bacterium]
MSSDIRTMPEGFGGVAYKDITNIHPLAAGAVVILGIAMLSVPRRLSIVPMMIIVCLIPAVQKISILGMDFNLLRIMVLFGVTRLLLRSEYAEFTWKPIDTALVIWAISSMVVFSMQQGSSSAMINRLGFGFDAFGMYFVFRSLIRDWDDIEYLVLGLIII